MTSEMTGQSLRVRTLLERSMVWDNHACMPLRPHDTAFLPQLQRCRDSGVAVVSLNVGFGDSTIEEHFRTLANMRYWFARHAEDYLLAATVEDIRTAKAEGKLAVLFDIEGMAAVGDQPSLVRLYYELGVRWMLVAYNKSNRAGGGCNDDDHGLTGFGRKIVDEMNACGMVACGSHTGYRTARELIDYSAAPVIFSHSNPRALWDHNRNIPDDLIKACAARGGVIGINGVGLFLGAGRSELVETLVRHIDYVVNLIGPDHVGLGLDHVYDQAELEAVLARMPELFPPELGFHPGMSLPIAGPEAVPAIAQGLVELGYDDDAVSAVLGGNWLRIAQEVWR